MSCFSHLFTSVINKRLEIVCRDNNLIYVCQFGFYKGSPAVDAIFILDALIQHFLKRNTRLYIVFVDSTLFIVMDYGLNYTEQAYRETFLEPLGTCIGTYKYGDKF